MTTSTFRHALVFTALFLFAMSCIPDSGSNSSTASSSLGTVENLKVTKDNDIAWGLTGMIRNQSSRPVRGAVKIKFLNASGDAVHNAGAFVNDNDPLQPGQAGSFEYYTEPENFDGVADYDIVFYER